MSTVKIIGAGITGPMAALTLARAGHAVTVFEQRPADALHSAGILGITEQNWRLLQKYGVSLHRALPDRTYRDVGQGMAQSPFHLIVWTDLHNAITDAAMDAGATFHYKTRADVAHVRADYVFDAGGIVSAARRKLPNRYIGSFIYRGISERKFGEAFTTYKLPNKQGFIDIGHTYEGHGSWAMGVRRPQPEHFGTTFTDKPPAEAGMLPREYYRVVHATPEIMVLPQSSWTVAPALNNPQWTRFTIGDANGPVRPITTSGANLGLQAGIRTVALMIGSAPTAAAMLRHRAYAIELGLRLKGPEIGGTLEDPNYAITQSGLYGPEWDSQ